MHDNVKYLSRFWEPKPFAEASRPIARTREFLSPWKGTTMKNIYFWRMFLVIGIALSFSGCARYSNHLYKVSHTNSDSAAIVFIKGQLIPTSVDGKQINFVRRGGRSFEVLRLDPGDHKIVLTYSLVKHGSSGVYVTKKTTTAGPWEKSINAKPEYIYMIDSTVKENKVFVNAFEVGPITLTTPDGNSLIALIIPDAIGKASFEYLVINNNDKKEQRYEVFEYPNQIPVFSPDKKRIAFGPITKSGKSFFVVDGKEELMFQVQGNRRFSPDSNTFVYRAKIDDMWHMITNGNKGKPYKSIWSPGFSSDGSVIGYIAKNNEDKYTAVINDKESKHYDNINNLKFSPTGTSVAFSAKQNNKEFVVINNVEGALYDQVAILKFSPDGKSLSYAAKTENKWHMILNETKSNPYSTIWSMRFSSTGKRSGFIARDNDRYFVVIDGNESGGFDGAWQPIFCNKENNVAYMVKLNEKKLVFLNGDKIDSYDDVRELKFSKDGKLTYEVKENGEWELIIKETAI